MSGNLKQIRIALVSIMLFFAASLSAQTVKGTVIDNTGEPVIGASVFEQGVQSNGVATDIDGNFTLTLKGNSKKLKISYIGMKTQIVNVAGKSTARGRVQQPQRRCRYRLRYSKEEGLDRFCVFHFF